MQSALIFADHRDIHALRVKERCETILGRDCSIVQTASFPKETLITTNLLGLSHESIIEAENNIRIPESVCGIWRRRLWRHKVSDDLESLSDREISRNDSRLALEGFFLACSDQLRVMNDPRTEVAGESKTYQLKIASECGIRIPITCISNDPSRVIEFVNANAQLGHQVIYKAFASPSNKFISTKLFDADDFERLSSLMFAPDIFQEFIEGIDLRITYVDGDIFPARIITRTRDANRDWRIDGISEVVHFPLSEHHSVQITKLMNRLGLVYGALDFKLTNDRELVFLEVNPWGQYLFVEIQTNLEISLSIAKWLVGIR